MQKSKGKKRIAVLRGGPGAEFDISMLTGAEVLAALNATDNIHALDITVTKNGDWLQDGVIKSPQDVLMSVESAFLAFRGSYGEDGTVQRILERYSIPYNGSGPYASAMASNKVLTKDHLREAGVLMAPHMLVTASALTNIHRAAESIAELFGPEYMLKPVTGGSKIGVQHVRNLAELTRALQKMLAEYDAVLVEEFIAGRVVSCGVIEGMRNQKQYLLPLTEHTTGGPVAPGRFSDIERSRIQAVSLLVHDTLGLSDFSLSDFVVSETGDVYFLEVNTLPTLHGENPVPVALEAVGISLPDFIIHITNRAS